MAHAVTLRDDLLYVEGGGINTMSPPGYPINFGGGLGVIVELEDGDELRPHLLTMDVTGPDGEPIATSTAEFETVLRDKEAYEPGRACFALDLTDMPILRAGVYTFHLQVDDLDGGTLSFFAR